MRRRSILTVFRYLFLTLPATMNRKNLNFLEIILSAGRSWAHTGKNPQRALDAKKLIAELLPALSARIDHDRNIMLSKNQRSAVIDLLQAIKKALPHFIKIILSWLFDILHVLETVSCYL